ncbi:MAG: transpeptidase family protein [Dysgonamonadaceae bacterium]|jgi:cell division protein FtsI (penicillin-binding protein 3)|nr:transpeptidase family protein [Dysgonamonadaceae bacterium]
MEKDDLEKKIQVRYLIVASILAVAVFTIPLRAFYIAFVEKEFWGKYDKIHEPKIVPLKAPRGNIFSRNGEIMATSDERYRLHVDFWADGINGDTLEKYVEPLSVELHQLLPSHSAEHYKTTIMNGWKIRKKQEEDIKNGKKVRKERDYKLDIPEINFLQLQKIRKMPWFKLGRNKTGLKAGDNVYMQRINPYGTLAARTIGDIYRNISQEKSGKSGLEKGYDSILSGKPGEAKQMRLESKDTRIVTKQAVPGYDVISTLEVNIQDVTECALLEKLQTLDAESGTAVVMDVSTGEIKAITNLGRVREGVWKESQNFALTDLSSPGSTFKVVSMMIMLDDGLVKPDDMVDTGNGSYTIPGSKYVIKDARRGGGRFTAAQSIKYSSNIGIGKLTTKAYGHRPEKYVEGIYRIGLNKDMGLEIPGYAVARIPHPKDKDRYWSGTDLFTMSFGYVNSIPPIYTLTFFNAIANNGKMVKPHFVRAVMDKNKIHEEKQPEILNSAICTPQTLYHIRAMLDSVVNAPDGTGKPVRSNIVRIAGKTGTAQLQDGRGGHQVSFCGYFPSDKPEYSCIVVIRRPRNGNASGGYMAGTVFKRIAEEITELSSIRIQDVFAAADSTKTKTPQTKSGHYDNVKHALRKLHIKHDNKSSGKWVTSVALPESNRIETVDRRFVDNQIPDVTGMSARDAVFALESSGMKVTLQGRGTVIRQLPPAGTKAVHGQKATIYLQTSNSNL